jgi:hypothetical protein
MYSLTITAAPHLFSADFIRQGDDLLLRGADGQEVFIEGYFSQSPPPPLETPEGARLTGETVEALAQTSVAQSYAQAGGFTLGQPIGEVTLLNGTARVQRADGTRENLSQGDPIFQGDVVATGVGSDLGILFIDETVFSLSANSRMLINELLYNPSSTVNSMGVSLIQGTFVFITGQVAPTGGMEVETPVGTIGIRGTTVGTQIATFGGRTTIANLEHPETGEIGSFTFSNGAGEAIFSEGNHFLQVTSANQPPGTPSVISGTQIAQTFGRALNTAVQVQRNASQQQDPGEEQEGFDCGYYQVAQGGRRANARKSGRGRGGCRESSRAFAAIVRKRHLRQPHLAAADRIVHAGHCRIDRLAFRTPLRGVQARCAR